MTYGAVAQCDSATHDDRRAGATCPSAASSRRDSARRHRACVRLDALRQPRRNRSQRHRGRTNGHDRNRAAGPGCTCAVTASVAAAPSLPIGLTPAGSSGRAPRRRHAASPQPLFPRAADAFALDTPVRSAQRPDAPPPVHVVQSVPLPTPRPAGLGHPRSRRQPCAARPLRRLSDDPFQKIFGKPEGSGPALAYAAADGGVFNNGKSISPGILPPNDGLTAIYDITARTVYMPDGTKLEAHSGLGRRSTTRATCM